MAAKKERTAFWCSLLLGGLLMSIGCSPATLGFILPMFMDDKVPAAFRLTDEKDTEKEVVVAIVSRFGEPQLHPDLYAADQEIAEKLASKIVAQCKENKEKIKFVSQSLVKSYMTKTIAGTA